MAVTLSSFKARFPEFDLDDAGSDTTQNALITAKIAEAESMIDRAIFVDPAQTNADVAVSYLTAHLLACSPSGINARLVKDKKGDPRTLYWPTYYRLTRGAACLLRRTS